MPRGKKKIRGDDFIPDDTVIGDEVEDETTPEPEPSNAETEAVKEIDSLRNLYQELLTRGIHSISEVEIKIQQEELKLSRIREKI